MSEEQPVYESGFSYRIHFARIKKLEKGGEVWFGEEYRLESKYLEAAKQEFVDWKEAHKDDVTIAKPTLLEIRVVKM